MHRFIRQPIFHSFKRVFSQGAAKPHHIRAEELTFEEPLSGYDIGGYHRASIGDLLASRYRILRKVGWGVYSTVWLVRDEVEKKLAAVKILTAVATAGQQHTPELEFLMSVRDGDASHPGKRHVLQLHDHFYCEGPNGKHLCLFTTLLGQNVESFSWRWGNKMLSPALVKRITKQTILGLDYLHNTYNIIHTDIKPANIFFTLDEGWSLTESTNVAIPLLEKDPIGRIVSRTPSSPIIVDIPQGDIESASTWNGISVQLGDLGVCMGISPLTSTFLTSALKACWGDKVDEYISDVIQSTALRAPEVCIGAGWNKPADIWSLGCLLHEMLMGEPIIPAKIHPDSVPYAHALLFGTYPQHMVERGKFSSKYYNADGTLKQPITKTQLLEDEMRQGCHPPDIDDFVDFLFLMLKLDPAERASTTELLAHKWLRSSLNTLSIERP